MTNTPAEVSPTIDLEVLERLAGKATPGPWVANEDGNDLPEGRESPYLDVLHNEPLGTSGHHCLQFLCSFNEARGGHLYEQMEADAQYVAACDPQTVAALVAAVKAARAFVTKMDEPECREFYRTGSSQAFVDMCATLQPFKVTK